MKQQLKLFLLLLITVTCFQANAQQQKIIAMSMVSSSPAGDSTQFGVPIFSPSTMFTALMSVILDNTDSIYQIHVKLAAPFTALSFFLLLLITT